ncbi:type I inositol polyphosphate 5-phosphatase 4 [Selaginella moellendorffii]|uniref:type I inositol polyphosphate 5-phosphatase 4 n=1 Tax=Selaginella moellendorffii TaxID=88036 RepID=UPI000D1C7B0B|nr:type I inositol polyphosphate 5-phosphatase 4 [Selaginella moellendorffii]|eukprot:XP_024531355.1 type I inositol polyphosphate 5-phosphatase 4 [Selaginella moellendorffii]
MKSGEAAGLWNCDCLGCCHFLRKLLPWRSCDYEFNADEWRCSDCESEDESGVGLYSRSYQTPVALSTAFQNFRIHAGTWNVGGRIPPSSLDLSSWVCSQTPADIYVFGFQEIVPLNVANVFGVEDDTPAVVWETLIRHTLNRGSRRASWTQEEETASTLGYVGEKQPLIAPLMSPDFSEDSKFPGQYVRIASKQMVGLFISVWIRREIRHVVSNVKVSSVGCGIFGYLGNKGSISVSLSIHRTSFCFICSHLTSGDREEDDKRRNTDVREILRRTSFPRSLRVSQTLPETILEHERIIWLGDLNYRVALSSDETMRLIGNQDYSSLLAKDQLKAQQGKGRVFEGWKEGHIKFAPTYKYIPDSDAYTMNGASANGRTRVPAWCDRILWLGKGLDQIAYLRSEYRISDHRPVSAVFTTQVECADK